MAHVFAMHVMGATHSLLDVHCTQRLPFMPPVRQKRFVGFLQSSIDVHSTHRFPLVQAGFVGSLQSVAVTHSTHRFPEQAGFVASLQSVGATHWTQRMVPAQIGVVGYAAHSPLAMQDAHVQELFIGLQ